MLTRIFSVVVVTLSIAVYAMPVAAERTCNNQVCADIQRLNDVNRPQVRARVILGSTADWAASTMLNRPWLYSGASHFNVRIEGGNQMEVSSTAGPPSFELQRGQRSFAAQACYKPCPACSSGCTKWANFSDQVAPPPPPPPTKVTVPQPESDVLPRRSGGAAAIRSILGAPAATPAPVKPAAVPAATKTATARNDVDIYNSPTQPRRVIGMMRAGSQAPVLQHHTDGWCKLDISIPKVVGWVAQNHLVGCP